MDNRSMIRAVIVKNDAYQFFRFDICDQMTSINPVTPMDSVFPTYVSGMVYVFVAGFPKKSW